MQATFILALVLLLTAPATEAADCGPGYFKKAARCEKCPPGTYQPYINAAKCRQCPANTFTNQYGVVDRTLCQPCPLNSFAKPASSACSKCPAAHVRASPTKCRPCRGDECKPCPKNHVRFQSGCRFQPKCPNALIPPPPGASYFSDATCIQPDNGCPLSLLLFGWYRRAVCMNKARKVVCPAGYVFDGVDRCLTCPTGMKVVKSSQNRLQCSRCDGYSVSKGGISRVCSKCSKNLYKSLDGAQCLTLQQFLDSLKAAASAS